MTLKYKMNTNLHLVLAWGLPASPSANNTESAECCSNSHLPTAWRSCQISWQRPELSDDNKVIILHAMLDTIQNCHYIIQHYCPPDTVFDHANSLTAADVRLLNPMTRPQFHLDPYLCATPTL